MYYKPHKLQKKSVETSKDDYGRVIGTSETWTDISPCRCDDNSQQEFGDENGKVYTPKYHIVAEGHVDVYAGDEVRCLRQDGTVRGEGKVYNAKHLNVLQYTDLWV